jgi:hypothetical protein
MIYSITMRFEEPTSGSIPARVMRVRENAELFICRLIGRGKCVAVARLLVQNACTKIVDRAPYRAAVVGTRLISLWRGP